MTITDRTKLTAKQVRDELEKELPRQYETGKHDIRETARLALHNLQQMFYDRRRKLKRLLDVLEAEEAATATEKADVKELPDDAED